MTQSNDRQWMIGSVFVLAVVVFMAGCLAGDLQVDPNRQASVRRIAVHPMEAPPLVVPTSFTLSMETIGGGRDAGILGLIVGGVVVATRGESISQEAQLWESQASRLESSQIWQPTEVVAQQVASHLNARTEYDVEIILPMTKLFVGEKRGKFNPYGPVRSWYNGDQAADGTLTADADLVVEVGIHDYELAQGLLAVGVVLRAVDPGNGEVLGRARAWDTPRAPSMELLFGNDAQTFKALFTDTTQQLTGQALSQLGL